MPNELEVNLQKTEAIEKEITELQSKLTGLEDTDKGLTEAISAKKRQIAELNEEAKKAREADKGHFEAARADNLKAAFSKLISQTPELSNNADMTARLESEFKKFDEGHFNPDEIFNDLRFAWLSLNRTKAFNALDEYERIPDEVRKQQMEQMGGAASKSGSPSEAQFTRDQSSTAEAFGTKPEYVKMAEGKSIISGGLISKDTPNAR